jgi:hypothetical protein
MGVTGKFATLEYIVSKLPEIPIAPFERVPRQERRFSSIFGTNAERIAKRLGYPVIVRSDGPEDRLGASFAGLFDSRVVLDPSSEPASNRIMGIKDEKYESIDEAVRKVRSRYDLERVEKYARDRYIAAPEGEIAAGMQKYVPALVRGLLTRHPHIPGAFFLDFELDIANVFGSDNLYPKRSGYVLEDPALAESCLKESLRQSDMGRTNARVHPSEYGKINTAVHHFTLVEQLERFDPSIAYQMEFSLFPYSFFQFRPFRRKEQASFRIVDVGTFDNAQYADLVFGVTARDGIVLKNRKGLDSYNEDPGAREASIELVSSAYRFIMNEARGNKVINHSLQLERELEICRLLQELGDLSETSLRFGKMGIVAPDFEYLATQLPALSIFFAPPNYGWQSHTNFRLLERAPLVAIGNINMPASDRIRYFSDGRQGLVVPL